MSLDKWMDKEVVVHIHNGILFIYQKEQLWVSSNEVTEHWTYYTEWSKSEREREISYLMAPHSSTLAWKIPWMEEPCRLQSMGSLRVRHDWAISLSLFTFMHWRRKWQSTPVFLPGESQGRGSLVGCRLWGLTESDMTEATQQNAYIWNLEKCFWRYLQDNKGGTYRAAMEKQT